LSIEIQHAKLTGGIQYRVPTHVLGFDLRFTLAKAALDIFILSIFVVSEAFDQVIEGFFEPEPSRLIGQSSGHTYLAGLKYTHIVSACHRLNDADKSQKVIIMLLKGSLATQHSLYSLHGVPRGPDRPES
jgi:hypothetical protein